MDEKFTQQMQAWLDTPKEKRDLAAGAMMVLKCNNNKILYQNVIRAPKRHAEVIEYNIKKWLKFRLQKKTHAEVEAMAASVKAIVAKHELNKIESTDKRDKPDTDGIAVGEGEDGMADNVGKDAKASKTGNAYNADKAQNQVGKRADHDMLPLEVQALYVENLDILRRMREVHLRLRTMTEKMKDGEMCPDSDRYPFLKELIELDKKYHSNWETYDKAEVEKTSVEPSKKVTKKSTRKSTKTPKKKG